VCVALKNTSFPKVIDKNHKHQQINTKQKVLGIVNLFILLAKKGTNSKVLFPISSNNFPPTKYPEMTKNMSRELERKKKFKNIITNSNKTTGY
jgi:hypothetical protein